MTPKPEKKKCCKQCRQEFKSGLVHCLGITTCPCHQPTEKIPTYVSNGRYIEKDGEPMFPNHPQPTEKVEKCSACPCKSPEAPDEWVGKTHCDCRCHLTPPPQSSEEWTAEKAAEIIKIIEEIPGKFLYLYTTIAEIIKAREQQAYEKGLVEGAEGGIGIPSYERGRSDERKKLKEMIEGMKKGTVVSLRMDYDFGHDHGYNRALADLLNKLQDYRDYEN